MSNLNIKEIIKTAFKFLFSAGIIYWLVSTGRFDFSPLRNLWSINIIAGGLILIAVNIALGMKRWLVLLHSQKVTTTHAQALQLTLIGIFFNFVVPGGIGGDVVKGFYIAQNNPEAKMKSVVSVAMDRLIGLYTMLIMALVAIVADWSVILQHQELLYIFYFLATLTVGFSLFWMVVFSRRLASLPLWPWIFGKLPGGPHLHKMFRSFTDFGVAKIVFVRALAISTIAQIICISFFIFIGKSLGFNLDLSAYFFAVPVGFMITAIPISPGGIGVGQAAFYYLFNLVDHQSANVGTIGITAMQLFQFAFGLLGAWFYVSLSHKMPKTVKSAS